MRDHMSKGVSVHLKARWTVYPENFVEISTHDLQRMGLKNGDKVRAVSASNPEGVWDLGNGTRIPMEAR